MRIIASMIGRELQWIQPSIFRRQYELRAGDIVVAKLEWVKFFAMKARAESADGRWLFDKTGIWKPTTAVRIPEEEAPLITFTEKWLGKKQSIVLPGGETLTMQSDLFCWKSSLFTHTGEPLLIIKRHGLFSRLYDVDLRRRGTSYPEFPWLVLLSWYLFLLARRRAQAHAS
ncbi:MAG: hypothetical protein HY562_09285 [Ignavibacteriales bacterium]|nr:hypothetical protein [Ignavibacteriales bacterium]